MFCRVLAEPNSFACLDYAVVIVLLSVEEYYIVLLPLWIISFASSNLSFCLGDEFLVCVTSCERRNFGFIDSQTMFVYHLLQNAPVYLAILFLMRLCPLSIPVQTFRIRNTS